MGVNNIEVKLKAAIIKALNQSGISSDSNLVVVIEKPKEKEFGDYSSNIAMQLVKVVKQNPRLIAQKIIDNFDYEEAGVAKIEIAGPGFINFFMKTDSLVSILNEILKQKENFGQNTSGKGIKYNIEFVSANPTGDLHIGHARQASLGDSICRILEKCGYSVTREYYVNDAGNQVHNLALSLMARYKQLLGVDAAFPEDGYHGSDIYDLAKMMIEDIKDKYINSDENDKEAYHYFRSNGIRLELEKIKKDLAYFRVHFDIFSSEQTIRDNQGSEKIIDYLNQKGYLYESEGATWFKSTIFGDDKDRVVIKSDGSYTYITPDIAYHQDKLNRGYDYLVDLLGADHHGYINRMKAAIMALGYDSNKLEIDIVQMVRAIKDGEEFKMSKRSGKALTLRDLCDEAGIDAIRYFFVARSGSSHLDFDIDLAIKQSNENPVYYAQYAHARMCSILAQAEKIELTADHLNAGELLTSSKEADLLKHLNDYIPTLISAAKERAPYRVVNYINKLAQLFHAFYSECKVIDENNLQLSKSRLSLVEATKIVLANALDLIGVTSPSKM